MRFVEAVRVIEEAGSFADLVSLAGSDPRPGSGPAARGRHGGGPGVAGVEPEAAYRMLSKIVHPDAAPATESATATRAFAKLSALWAGRTPALIASGDIADLHPDRGGAAVLKVPRRPADNDLMAAEAWALRTLWTDGDPKHRGYAPRLIDSFTQEDRHRVRRTANVLDRLHGFVPLAEVLRRRPDGIDPRDAAWMWRRLLVALGWAHRAGVVHGAVLPEHVLIHPGEHGLVLVDWCYAVRPGTVVAALVAQHRNDYPPEVRAKKPASPATDLFMATVLIGRLMRNAPKPIGRFLSGCRYDAPRMRPQDAWALLEELDELLANLYGERKFRPFTV